MMIAKKLYNKPRRKPWLILRRAGYRAELQNYYEPKMQYIRNLYEEQDFVMLRICLKELKDKSLFFANHNMGFAVTTELFHILIIMLKFQGRHAYADKLVKKTTPNLQNTMIERGIRENEN